MPDQREDSNPDEEDWNPDPATVPCPECGAEVWEEADRCPDCGHYFTTDDVNAGRSVWYRVVVAFVIGLLVWALVMWW